MADASFDSTATTSSSPNVPRTSYSAQLESIYVGLGLLMIGISVAGFWESYFGPLAYGTLDAHWAIDLHAAIYTTWLFLFLGQAALIYRGRVRSHQSVGRYIGLGWGAGILAIGLFVTLAVIVPGVGRDHEVGNYAPSLLGSLGDLVTFGGFFVAGLLYRTRPEVHKRLMVLATVAMLGAPVARLDLWDGLLGFSVFAGIRLSPALLAMAYDRWTWGRVHLVYWIGMGVLLLNVSRLFWGRTALWQSIARALMEPFAPVLRALLGG